MLKILIKFYGIMTQFILFYNNVNGSLLGGTLNEYCHAETFNPTCDEDEVILVHSASYGQMKIGRCIDGDYGYLGCTSNQLINLDKKCSGQQTCLVDVDDTSMTEKGNCTIPHIFKQYLEARFTCVKVYQADERCTKSHKITLKSGKLNIASMTTKTTGCGLESKPWLLEAKPGQKINISLTDFKWIPQISSLIKCPERYGYIIDVDVNQLVDICGGSGRKKHIYTSEGSSLQVIIDNNHIEDARFLLSFEVLGCPEFNAPQDTWTRVEDDKVITVGCIDSDKIWKMRCIGNHWIGIIGKCDKVVQSDSENTIPLQSKHTVFGLSPAVGYSLIGGMFLVILCVTVTTIIGYFCIRKQKSPSKEYYLPPLQYQANSTLPLHTYPSHSVSSRGVHNDHNHTLLLNAPQGTLMSASLPNHDLMQNNLTNVPQYFVLENRGEGGKEPIYDAVYQNIGDPNSA